MPSTADYPGSKHGRLAERSSMDARGETMTRKHYKRFAEMLAELRNAGADETTLFTVEQQLILICLDDNPRFNPARFRQAARGYK